MNKITVCTVCLELATPTPCRKCGNTDIRLLTDATGRENKRGMYVLTLEQTDVQTMDIDHCTECSVMMDWDKDTYWRLDHGKWLDSKDFCSLKCLKSWVEKRRDG